MTGPLPDGLRELADLETVDIADTELCAPEDDAFQAWLATITFSGLICPPAEQSVIDVAVFYTPAARNSVGGTDAIEAEIALMVAETNQAYVAGGVKQRVTLVAVQETAYTESGYLPETALIRLVNGSDGYMDEVYAVRNRVAADIVVLVRMGSGVSSVVRLLQPLSSSFDPDTFPAFASVFLPSGSITFAHELGHIMGLAHDRYTDCSSGSCASSVSFPYAYGYVNQQGLHPAPQVSSDDRWVTIMAYADIQCLHEGYDCFNVPRFSNAEQTYRHVGGTQAFPLGIAGLAPSDAVDGPSDAVRALNRTRAYVAKFRQAPDITVSFSAEEYEATEGGTTATVTVELSAAPTRPIDIPLTLMAAGATAYDYTGVPASVHFDANETEQTFTVTAQDDAADDDDESITLSFGGPLPRGVTLDSPSATTVSLTDNDVVTGAPSILSVELTSDPGADGIYAAGDVIEASVRFTKTVTVAGQPQLELTVGSDTPAATYRDSAGEVARFVYTVDDGASDDNGVSIAADSLDSSGTIRASGNQDAVRTHSAVADNVNHRVDGVGPVLQEAQVALTALTLLYTEALDETAVPATAAFTVRVNGKARRVTAVAVHGSEVTLTLRPAVFYGAEHAGGLHTGGGAASGCARQPSGRLHRPGWDGWGMVRRPHHSHLDRDHDPGSARCDAA